jgi:hypothetical protein
MLMTSAIRLEVGIHWSGDLNAEQVIEGVAIGGPLSARDQQK